MQKRFTDIRKFDDVELPKLNDMLRNLFDWVSRIQYDEVTTASTAPTGGTHGELKLQDDGTSRILWVNIASTWYNVGDLISNIIDHTHSSTSGQGGQLDWDDIWSDAVHSHASNAEGGKLDVDTCFSDFVHDHSSAAEGDAVPEASVTFNGSGHDHSGTTNGSLLDWDDCWSDAVHDHSSNAEGGTLSSSSISPPGNDTEIIFNDSGVFGAESQLTWDKTDTILSLYAQATKSGIFRLYGNMFQVGKRASVEFWMYPAGGPSFYKKGDIYIKYNDSTFYINAITDLEIQINGATAFTVDTNKDTLFDGGNKIQFRDSAIHIQSANDGHLDLTADTSIDLNGEVIGSAGMSSYGNRDNLRYAFMMG